MADTASWIAQGLNSIDDDDLFVDIKPKEVKTHLRVVQATTKRYNDRSTAEAQQQRRRTAEAAAFAKDFDEFMAAGEDPSAKEINLKAMQQQVQEQLEEDADAVGPEPPRYAPVIHPVQALPALQLQQLAVLQPLLSLPQELLGATPSSSNDETQAAAVFAWLLVQREQLAVCPDAVTAQAVFRAVWCGSSGLAAAACSKFLSWCGMWECQAGSDVPRALKVAAASGSIDSSALCGAPPLADLQPPVTIQWLPSAADFAEALTAMGCSLPAAGGGGSTATPAPGKKQQQAEGGAAAAAAAVTPAGASAGAAELQYADSNLLLLLQLLTRVCRLGGEGGRLPLQLGQAPAALKQLSLLLLALLLDPRACGSAAGRAALHDVVGALLGALSDAEWRRLEGQLLEALAPPGLGPSARSTVLLLSQLPLTERCVSLRQQGALQLLAKLLPGKKQQPPPARSSRSSRPSAHDSLLQLLGRQPDKALVKALLPGPSSSAGQRLQMDTWTALDILDAAHLVLWADVLRAGGCAGLSADMRSWFYGWMDKLEQRLSTNLKLSRLKGRLTELKNAYEWSSKLGIRPDAEAAAGDSGMEDDSGKPS